MPHIDVGCQIHTFSLGLWISRGAPFLSIAVSVGWVL